MLPPNNPTLCLLKYAILCPNFRAGVRFAVIQGSGRMCRVLSGWRYIPYFFFFFFFDYSSVLRWMKGLWLVLSSKWGVLIELAPSIPWQLARRKCCFLRICTMPSSFQKGSMEKAQINLCSEHGCLEQTGCIHQNLMSSRMEIFHPAWGWPWECQLQEQAGGGCPSQIFRLFLLLADVWLADINNPSFLTGIWFVWSLEVDTESTRQFEE